MRRTFEGGDAPKTTGLNYHDKTPTRIPAPVGTFTPSTLTQRNKTKSKSGTLKSGLQVRSNGKGKATIWDSPDDSKYGDDDKDDDDDDAYLTSHDFEDEPVQGKSGTNETHLMSFRERVDYNEEDTQGVSEESERTTR